MEQDNSNVDNVQEEEIGRRYQIALCEMAKKENIIICLPTGSGKTYIALQLVKFYLPEAVQHNKKIVFLANTVPLVHQQANYLRKQLFLSFGQNNKQSHVTELTGDMNVDIWDDEKWIEVAAQSQIMVMTSQILLDALSHSYLNFKEINLLVLDECHHTDKDHPMSKIMEKYSDTRRENPDYVLPRVLGLTATIIKGTLKKEVDTEVYDIEKRLCCRAVTYHDYEEVLKHSTNAKVKMEDFTRCPQKTELSNLITKFLDDTKNEISDMAQHMEDDTLEVIASANQSTLKEAKQIFRKNKTPIDDLKKILTDVRKMFDEESLGLYGARLAAILKRCYLHMMNSENSVLMHLKIAADTCLARVISECDNVLENELKCHQIQDLVSSKVKKLFDVLLDWHQKHKNEELCGIVFCNERMTAQILTWIFQDAAQHCGEKFKFIKPAFVVGSSRFNNDLEEQRITTKKQEETIQKFHKKIVNLIFATNVLEEGLNVPSCNVVIRFDPLLTYPSFVQSMGRARKRGALFCMLTSDTNLQANKDLIERFTNFNLDLANHLKENGTHVDEDDIDHQSPSSPTRDSALAIDPSNPDSPRVTLTDAVQLVHRLLTCDRFVKMEPLSWWVPVGEENNEKLYKAFVMLPSNAVFRDVIESDEPKTSKNDAKRSAFLNVCKQLYKHGALDERLFPRRRPIPAKVLNFLKEVEQKAERSSISNKKLQWYPKMNPKCIESSSIKAGDTFTVYIPKFSIIEKTADSTEHLQLYNFDNKRHTLAVLSQTDLNDIPPGYLHTRHGILESSFEKINLKSCSSVNVDEFARIKKFQEFIFSKTLKMEHHLMKDAGKDSLLIVALVRDGNGDWDIDWTLFEKLESIEEDNYRTPMTESQRSNTSWSVEDYEDAVVVPWYKAPEYGLEFYCVCSIRDDLNPSSPLDATEPHPKSLGDYYSQKYQLTIMNPDRPFLSVASLGKQLNYLVKKKDSTKMSKQERKDHRYLSSIQTLVPEFVRIYPLPASVLVQARFMPSILHRTYRLMLGRQIQISVAEKFDWGAALNCKAGDGMEVVGCCQNFHVKNCKCTTASGTQEVADTLKVRTETAQMLSLANFGQLASTSNSTDTVRVPSPDAPDEVDGMVPGEVMHLDYVHPDTICSRDINSHMAWRSNRVRSILLNDSQDSPSRSVTDQSVENAYPLIDLADVKLPSIDTKTIFSEVCGPTADTVMEAITLSNALDSISLESLEVIGDSFLKYIVSSHIFMEFPQEDEGVMTQMRTQLISNRHLYIAGTNKSLGEYLSGGIFIPESSWLPPGVTIPQVALETAVLLEKNLDIFDNMTKSEIEQMSVTELKDRIEKSSDKDLSRTPNHTSFTHSRMANKRVADCLEALIGAYYMKSGIDGALRFMDWAGLQAPISSGEGIVYKRPTYVKPVVTIPASSERMTPEEFLPLIDELEDLIGYEFNDRWLVVEAFTHPGYIDNVVTNCFQRLEYLGDAVLDFLVTNHIYKNGLASTPGELTDLRSALVNNVTFGSLTVRYGFQKFLLSISKQLQDVIDNFETYQNENGHAVTGHFKLLNDFECPVAEDVEVPKVLGDIFESLAGAVFLDSNLSLDTTWKIFYRLMKNEIDMFATPNTPKSPVRVLYELFTGITFREYDDSERRSESMFQSYTVVSVSVNGKTFIGRGNSKKAAKQAAAKLALRTITDEGRAT